MQVRPKYAQGARSVPGTIADVPEGQPGTEQVPEHPSWDLAQSRCPQHLPQGLGQVLPYDSFSPLIHNLEIGCQNLRGFVSNPDVTLKERLLLLNCWTRGKEVGYFEHAHTAKTHPPLLSVECCYEATGPGARSQPLASSLGCISLVGWDF